MKLIGQTKKSYELTYANGYDKSYPSLEVVRLENLFFNNQKGRVLDFGCGPGTNGIHFLKKGYNVTFCDISENALKKLRIKLKSLKIKKNFRIINLSKNKNFLKTKKQLFDYIICFSVFNNLGDQRNAELFVKFFYSILRFNGKIIIDSNLKGKHNYKIVNRKKNLYTTHPNNNFKLKMYFPTRSVFIKIIKRNGFKINDIGRAMFKIFDSKEDEIIISATKK